jgi:hypothetical protein
MDLISKWLTIRCKQKYLGERYEQDLIIDKLSRLLLGNALHIGATRIVFGEPAETHPDIDLSLCQPMEATNDLEDIEKELAGVGHTVKQDCFGDDPHKMMPVWIKINGQWRQTESIPLRLLHLIVFHIEGLAIIERDGIPIEVGDNKVAMVDVTITCEANYHYAIDLKTRC